MDIRVEIPVPLQDGARKKYVEENIASIDGVQRYRVESDVIRVTADFSTPAEGKSVMKKLNRINGVGLVDTWYLV